MWFYNPSKRKPRRDGKEWVRGTPAIVIEAWKSSKKRTADVMGIEHQSAGKRGLAFGGKEYKVGPNENVILNHGSDNRTG